MKLVLEIRKASLYPKIDVFSAALTEMYGICVVQTGLKFCVESFGGGPSIVAKPQK